MKNILESIAGVCAPTTCLVCSSGFESNISNICSVCENLLPYTSFETITTETKLDKLFWGRLNVERTYAYLFFEKGNATQEILHGLKYKNRKDFGLYFGKRMAETIQNNLSFSEIDCIVPVPLHHLKQFDRGFNQAEAIARGISSILKIPLNNKLVNRYYFTETQTKKDRIARWDNLQNRFKSKALKNIPSHVMIVDDVITTGATIETVARILLEINPKMKFSVVSLAISN